MTERIVASREDPRTLVPAARAMYEAGKTRSEVLTAIYGVDLPREAVLIERDYVAGKKKPIRAMWKTHPWELMIPLERGGPQFMLGSLEYDSDRHAFAQAPHVLLVAWLCYARVPTGFSLIGYDLREVAAGRSTVVGLLPPDERQVPESGATFTVLGSSLIDVFADVISSYLASWGDLESRDAAEERRDAKRELAGIEALRRELVDSPP
jgi:hypothetical protein